MATKKATDLQPGDKIGRNVKVHNVRLTSDSVIAAWRQKGSKAPGVSRYRHDEDVPIFNDRRK